MTLATTRPGRPTRLESDQRRGIARQRGRGKVARRRTLPEYLDAAEVVALMRFAPRPDAALLFLIMWRAALRISEALALRLADLSLDGDPPTLRVRKGKGGRARVLEMHPELVAGIKAAQTYGLVSSAGLIIHASRQTGWRWVQQARAKAQAAGALPQGRDFGPHVLRHSAARHWLASGVPLNVVSRWMGHASLQTTLIYLEILPDPLGYMERVP